jgi:hypothetical protein
MVSTFNSIYYVIIGFVSWLALTGSSPSSSAPASQPRWHDTFRTYARGYAFHVPCPREPCSLFLTLDLGSGPAVHHRKV